MHSVGSTLEEYKMFPSFKVLQIYVHLIQGTLLLLMFLVVAMFWLRFVIQALCKELPALSHLT